MLHVRHARLRAPAIVALLLLCGRPAAGAPPNRFALADLAKHYGFQPPTVQGQMHRLHSRYSDLTFGEGSRQARYNGTLILLHRGLLPENGAWGLQRVDVETVLDPLLRSRDALRGMGRRVVVLDPGHGGEDGGARNSTMLEKDLALELTRRMQVLLQASGATVHVTRTRDVYVPLEERCRMAARWKADLLVSLHFNSASSGAARGFETFILPAAGESSTNADRVDARAYAGNRFDRQNMVLGYLVHRGLCAYATGEDRGLKRARFVVLREAPCPATLVECGFLSSAEDTRRIGTRKHRMQLAEGVANGILTYLERVAEAQASARSRTAAK